MSVQIYKSTDASAPVLTGLAGSLIALLDAVLINGYGALAAAGWAKAFSGTNLAAYRPPVGGNRFFLMVNDTGATNGRCVGYETMSAISVGTGNFPTAAQVAGGMYWPKSSSADATARPWIIAATDRLLIMHVSSNSTTNATNASVCVFGDIKSYKAGDAYGTIHIAGTGSTPSDSNNFFALAGALSGASAGHFMAHTHAQTGTSVTIGKHTDMLKSVSTTRMGDDGGLTYPHPPDGGLYMAPVWVHTHRSGCSRDDPRSVGSAAQQAPGTPGYVLGHRGACRTHVPRLEDV